MSPAYFVYRFLTLLLYYFLMPPVFMSGFLTRKRDPSFFQRVGVYPDKLREKVTGRNKIWMHASSVGEVGAAIPVIEALLESLPECSIVFSTATRHGHSAATQYLKNKTAVCVLAPLDFVCSVKKALLFFKPDMLVCLETEIWPNWFFEANRMGMKVVIVNGRISHRSIKNYMRIRPLFRAVLSKVDAFSMINIEDAKRICRIGAPKERVSVHGNAKYDHLTKLARPEKEAEMRSIFGVSPLKKVFVAGSTRKGEEEIVLNVYKQIVSSFPDTILIIAPRHVERAYTVETIVRKAGLSCQLRTDLDKRNGIRNAPVVIMDTIGELQDVYSIATVVFCGGSLVPKGGHNVLEPAVWGKPVLFGPSMEDFADARELLEKVEGGLAVKNSFELAEKVIDLFGDMKKAEKMGECARKAVLSNRGAAQKHADLIRALL